MSGENDHGRTKYLREIYNVNGDPLPDIDVYSVLDAFDVRNPALAHAVKKLLCPGRRGKGDFEQDLREAIVAIERAITIGATDE